MFSAAMYTISLFHSPIYPPQHIVIVVVFTWSWMLMPLLHSQCLSTKRFVFTLCICILIKLFIQWLTYRQQCFLVFILSLLFSFHIAVSIPFAPCHLIMKFDECKQVFVRISVKSWIPFIIRTLFFFEINFHTNHSPCASLIELHRSLRTLKGSYSKR